MRPLAPILSCILLASGTACTWAQDMSGHYNITVQCVLGNGYGELDIIGSGRTFKIVGSSRGGTYSGTVNNNRVSMKFIGSGNEAEFYGSVKGAGELAGSMTQKASFGGACSWNATRTSGAPAQLQVASPSDRGESVDPSDPNRCLQPAGKKAPQKTGPTAIYKIYIRNTCKNVVHIRVLTCEGRNTCAWGKASASGKTISSFDSFFRYPEWKVE